MFTKPELCVRAQYSLYITGDILSFERADTGYLGSCVHFQLCLWRPQDVSVFVATKQGILGQIMTFIFNPNQVVFVHHIHYSVDKADFFRYW